MATQDTQKLQPASEQEPTPGRDKPDVDWIKVDSVPESNKPKGCFESLRFVAQIQEAVEQDCNSASLLNLKATIKGPQNYNISCVASYHPGKKTLANRSLHPSPPREPSESPKQRLNRVSVGLAQTGLRKCKPREGPEKLLKPPRLAQTPSPVPHAASSVSKKMALVARNAALHQEAEKPEVKPDNFSRLKAREGLLQLKNNYRYEPVHSFPDPGYFNRCSGDSPSLQPNLAQTCVEGCRSREDTKPELLMFRQCWMQERRLLQEHTRGRGQLRLRLPMFVNDDFNHFYTTREQDSPRLPDPQTSGHWYDPLSEQHSPDVGSEESRFDWTEIVKDKDEDITTDLIPVKPIGGGRKQRRVSAVLLVVPVQDKEMRRMDEVNAMLSETDDRDGDANENANNSRDHIKYENEQEQEKNKGGNVEYVHGFGDSNSARYSQRLYETEAKTNLSTDWRRTGVDSMHTNLIAIAAERKKVLHRPILSAFLTKECPIALKTDKDMNRANRKIPKMSVALKAAKPLNTRDVQLNLREAKLQPEWHLITLCGPQSNSVRSQTEANVRERLQALEELRLVPLDNSLASLNSAPELLYEPTGQKLERPIQCLNFAFRQLLLAHLDSFLDLQRSNEYNQEVMLRVNAEAGMTLSLQTLCAQLVGRANKAEMFENEKAISPFIFYAGEGFHPTSGNEDSDANLNASNDRAVCLEVPDSSEEDLDPIDDLLFDNDRDTVREIISGMRARHLRGRQDNSSMRPASAPLRSVKLGSTLDEASPDVPQAVSEENISSRSGLGSESKSKSKSKSKSRSKSKSTSKQGEEASDRVGNMEEMKQECLVNMGTDRPFYSDEGRETDKVYPIPSLPRSVALHEDMPLSPSQGRNNIYVAPPKETQTGREVQGSSESRQRKWWQSRSKATREARKLRDLASRGLICKQRGRAQVKARTSQTNLPWWGLYDKLRASATMVLPERNPPQKVLEGDYGKSAQKRRNAIMSVAGGQFSPRGTNKLLKAVQRVLPYEVTLVLY